MIISGTYDPWLVGLSILVAVLASYTALDLAGPVAAEKGTARALWLAAAATAAGGAIWSMHFIGMLAFDMGMPVTYDLRITLASLATPILVTGLGLLIVARDPLTLPRLGVGGLLMGLGIIFMHYLGMAGMEMEAEITYDPWRVGASVLIAIGAATSALWLVHRRQTIAQKIAAACAMGTAIAGMHYTGMAAARFVMAPGLPAPLAPVLAPSALAVAIAATTIIILFLALVASQIRQHRMVLKAERAADAVVRASEAKLRLAVEATELGIWDWDLDRNAISWSDRAKAIVGAPPDAVLGYATFLARVHADDRARVEAAVAHALDPAGAGLYAIEYRIVRPEGLRWVLARARATFAGDDLRRPVRLLGTIQDITGRKQVEEHLTAALAETEMLLAEIHHRVRNNLQVIISLMQLDAGEIADAETRGRLERIAERIGALGRIHDQIYRFGHFGRIDLRRYLEDLCASLADLHRETSDVAIEVRAAPLTCNLETAIPVGLIANELVTNSLKHGFPDRRAGRIVVEVRRAGGVVELTVADDGVGAASLEGTGLGQRLIRALVQQLDGTLRQDPAPGTRITLAVAGERFVEDVTSPPVAGHWQQ